MTKVEIDTDKSKSIAALLLLVAFFVLPLGIGILYGAGVGWIVFGLFLIAAAYRLIQVAQKEDKRKQEEAQARQYAGERQDREDEENARYGG